jgi:hypothetical protein
MPSTLEQRYSWLLLSYPAKYRRTHGPELIGTLMALSQPGRRWPSVADAVDLLAGGFRRRLGFTTVPGFPAGLALAGPVALALAAGTGGYYILGELAAAGSLVSPRGYHGLGPFATIGPIIYFGWLLAAAGRAILPRAASRWLIGLAVATIPAVVPVAALTGLTRPSLPFLVPMLLVGLIALAGSDHHPTRVERLGVAFGSVAATGALVGLTYWYAADLVWVGFDGVPVRQPTPLEGTFPAMSLTVVALPRCPASSRWSPATKRCEARSTSDGLVAPSPGSWRAPGSR